MKRFEDQTAIVTGATSGIGLAVTRRLVSEGGRVVAVARDGARGAQVLEDLTAESISLVEGDVAEAQTAAAAVEAAEAAGGLDVLVNNAGVDHTGDLLETPLAEVRELFETNFFGALLMLQHAARAMKAGSGGSIVNVTSRLATIGVESMCLYAASKGALSALTTGAAVELAPAGIRVNAVAPGLTETALFNEWIESQPDPDRFRRQVAATIPQGRFATPEEVAATVAFLASDEATHITGASVAIDGGYTAA